MTRPATTTSSGLPCESSTSSTATRLRPACSPRTRLKMPTCSRKSAAFSFAAKRVLGACSKRVDNGQIPPSAIAIVELRPIALLDDEQLDELVKKHWGRVGPGTPGEQLALMRKHTNDLNRGTGDPAAGKILFTKHCGICHKLFGEGQDVGPDLTDTNRLDRVALLANVVDPSAVVKRDYQTYAVVSNGRQLTGLIKQQDAASLTLVDSQGKATRISREDVEEIFELPTSTMPERILENLSPQEVRDSVQLLRAER